MRKLLIGFLFLLMTGLQFSCMSSGTIYRDYSGPEELYYESANDMLVVYISSVPYYLKWDYSRNVYYYNPVPRGYWRYIEYTGGTYRLPVYYRKLPNPYYRNHRPHHYPDRYRKPDHNRKPKQPNRPSYEHKKQKPDRPSARRSSSDRRTDRSR